MIRNQPEVLQTQSFLLMSARQCDDRQPPQHHCITLAYPPSSNPNGGHSNLNEVSLHTLPHSKIFQRFRLVKFIEKFKTRLKI